jgi:hypothetical protein
MSEPEYRHYWRVLYPKFADPKSTAHWYGRWKTAGMCMGLFDERQQARHKWIAVGPRRGAKNPTRLRLSPTTRRPCGR